VNRLASYSLLRRSRSAQRSSIFVSIDGRKLLTLKGAADYITKLPKDESALPEWQTAIEVLMLCSRGATLRWRGSRS
jgi:hypothetical protein